MTNSSSTVPHTGYERAAPCPGKASNTNKQDKLSAVSIVAVCLFLQASSSSVTCVIREIYVTQLVQSTRIGRYRVQRPTELAFLTTALRTLILFSIACCANL